ncbi:MAG: 16S rRNA (adenine(1518)-N(6)/adenine(1519)-N(6))-dimethyltransferase RsmA [Candidatus Thermoplasmatota archaeon]
MVRKLGQNFLVDRRVAEREVEFADVDKEDVVLEIGPGKGVLTCLLAEKAKKVVAVEIDENLYEELKSTLPENVLLINKDILKIDLDDLPFFNKIVSNLPFQISSPITFKFLEYPFDLAVLIYQKEFAERMVAKPGSKHYSRLTVNIYYHASCEIVDYISKKCFKPEPRVDSAVVKMVPHDKPPFYVVDEDFYFELTLNLFNHRRKKIRTTLKNCYNIEDFNEVPFLDRRVEKLNPEEIGRLSNILYKKTG